MAQGRTWVIVPMPTVLVVTESVWTGQSGYLLAVKPDRCILTSVVLLTPDVLLPGWPSVSTRESVAPGMVRSTSCQDMSWSAPIQPRLGQSWWVYWERWIRTTAETCSSTTASSACFVMKKLVLQVTLGELPLAPLTRQCFYLFSIHLLLFSSVLPLRGAVPAVSHGWFHHSPVLRNTAFHCSQPDLGTEGPR